MRTLFITSFHSFVSKNVLNTDVLRTLQVEPDLRIVIFVPESKVAFFERHYGAENVLVRGVNTSRIIRSKAYAFFSRLFFLMIDSHYIRYKRMERRDARTTAVGRIKYALSAGLAKIMSGSRSLNRIARFFYFHMGARDILKPYFERYEPSLVFSTDIFDHVDAHFLKEAKWRHVPSIGMVRSWDNCYSKGLLPVIPDDILVNNGIIKDEVVTLHDAPPGRVMVVGLPQFDAFVNERRTARHAFFDAIGVDPGKRLILFAPAGTILSETDWQICDLLEKAEKEGRFGHPVHVFVRNHPNHPADLTRFQRNPLFTIQEPGHTFGKNPKHTELDPNDQRFLADLLFHSDVVMHVVTSIGLDAAVYDKPQIMLDFDGYDKKTYAKSVRRYHDEEHMKKLIATGGVRMAHDEGELIGQINAYLDNPGLDAEGRQRIVDEQLFRIDGKSSQRVVREVLRHLPTVSSPYERNR